MVGRTACHIGRIGGLQHEPTVGWQEHHKHEDSPLPLSVIGGESKGCTNADALEAALGPLRTVLDCVDFLLSPQRVNYMMHANNLNHEGKG